MSRRLVIFDCDGVLVDSERLVTRLEAEQISDLGWSLSQADVIARFVGRSERHMIDEIARNVDGGLPAGWHTQLRDKTHALFRAELRPIDGVVDAVRVVRARHDACVASSSDHARLRLVLGLTGLQDAFVGHVYSAQDVTHGKPAPDLFLHAAEREGYEPASCVVVEDSVPGVQAAVAAGMRVLGYGRGLTAPDALAHAGAEVFDRMQELPERIAAI